LSAINAGITKNGTIHQNILNKSGIMKDGEIPKNVIEAEVNRVIQEDNRNINNKS